MPKHIALNFVAAVALTAWIAASIGLGQFDAKGEPSQTETVPQSPGDTPSGPMANGAGPSPKSPAGPEEGSERLILNFDRTPWREVIEWVADQCDLAIQFNELPTGSFTYRDTAEFSPDEAIDRINLFLLPEGFSVVRSGRLLTVIDMNDPRSLMQLDVLAEVISPQDLERRSPHEVVKCFFPLGELKPDEALEELAPLNLMRPPSTFARTNQILVTGTVSQLRNVRDIIASFQPKTLDNGTVVKSFALQHATAEDILAVARPHLGLATGETIGIDVSVSTDPAGKYIFVTGVEDKVKLIETLVEAIDRPSGNLTTADGRMVLQSHRVSGENLEMIYNVLQTLLAGNEMRLSMDPASRRIIALAAPEIHAEIEQTIAQMQASDAEFAVIDLKTIEPEFAIGLLEEMLDLPDPLIDDPDEIDPDAPKIDADRLHHRLFVRAKPDDLEAIRRIVAELDDPRGSSATSRSDPAETVRLLPLAGTTAQRMLEVAGKFWHDANPIVLFPGELDAGGAIAERAIYPEAGSETQRTRLTSARRRGEVVLASGSNPDSEPIHCQWTPRGLILHSQDTAALDRFEAHLRSVIGPLDRVPSTPTVFYLKFVRADDAVRMLAELLDGGASALESATSGLVNGYVASDGWTTSLVTSRDGLLTLLADTMTVVADTRLNRLIAQGTAADLDRLEQYLKIVDKDRGLTSVETYGRPHIVELQHTLASDVAATLREAFAGRIVASTSGGGTPGGAPPAAGRPGDASKGSAAKGKDSKNDKNAAARPQAKPIDLEPKMTIAVHEPSNSLIITAPDSLFEQAAELISQIDQLSEQTVEIIAPEEAGLLRSMLQPSSPTRPASALRGSGSTSASRGDDAARRAQMFQQLREKIGGR
ncbi:MAG: general secretion pathway protein [Planctomycetota bacterium]|nr:MAG: general secretion pathway protein [Planctomycetota bacterium]